MSEQYIEVPIETDPELLQQESFDYLEAVYPDWVPNDANLETIVVEALSRMTAEARDVASAVPTDIFRYFGNLVDILPQQATYATALTNWTVIDGQGYTIEAGTQVGIELSGSEIVPFEVVADWVIPPTFTVANGVEIRAMEAGAEQSGITGPVTLVDTLDYVTGITLVAPTSGGIDEEEDDDYLNRLRVRLQLLAPRPILARDFAIFAQDIPEVGRAVAIDGYNPADQTFNNERMVAVAVVDDEGEALSAPIKAEVDTYLQSVREVNFVVNVIDPTYTTIDVNFTAKSLSGWVPADVETRAEAAVAEYLDPANWGLPQDVGDIAFSPHWVNVTVVRYLELAQVINSVSGLDYITALTLRKGADPFASTDVTMTGAVTMPRPGVITGTVTA